MRKMMMPKPERAKIAQAPRNSWSKREWNRWFKLSQIEQVRALLNEGEGLYPILHNKGEVIIQGCGWSVNLLPDGTWFWEDTTGG